jgi:hypothetical protein
MMYRVSLFSRNPWQAPLYKAYFAEIWMFYFFENGLLSFWDVFLVYVLAACDWNRTACWFSGNRSFIDGDVFRRGLRQLALITTPQ